MKLRKFKQLKNGDKFQFVNSHHSMAEYEKVDDAYYRLADVGGVCIPISKCPKGDNEPIVTHFTSVKEK
jgi:predicted glycoside hydrolase/deacetylase ChbG (UPF0249 family)